MVIYTLMMNVCLLLGEGFFNLKRIADPQDILGSVLVKNGIIVPNSFVAMPTHRIVTRDGLFKLNAFFHQKLLENLQ